MPKQYADDAYLLTLFPQLKKLQRAQWRLTVLSAADGNYSITANADPDYTATAAGDTPTTLRGKLRTAVNGSSTLITAMANSTTQLILQEVKADSVVALAVDPEAALQLELIAPSDPNAALREAWLEATKEEVGLCAWGEKASLGHAALAAAFISLVQGVDGDTGLGTTGATGMRLGPAEIRWGGGGSYGATIDAMLANNDFYKIYLKFQSSLVVTPVTDLGSCGVLCA